MRQWRNLFAVMALITLIIVFVAHVARRNHVTVAYERVRVGMTRDEVYAELGAPSACCIQGGGVHRWTRGWARPRRLSLGRFRPQRRASGC